MWNTWKLSVIIVTASIFQIRSHLNRYLSWRFLRWACDDKYKSDEFHASSSPTEAIVFPTFFCLTEHFRAPNLGSFVDRSVFEPSIVPRTGPTPADCADLALRRVEEFESIVQSRKPVLRSWVNSVRRCPTVQCGNTKWIISTEYLPTCFFSHLLTLTGRCTPSSHRPLNGTEPTGGPDDLCRLGTNHGENHRAGTK